MRQKWRLYQGWFFCPEDLPVQRAEKGPREEKHVWEGVTLPHTFRLEPYNRRNITTAQGIGTYVKYFSLDMKLKEKCLYLTFDAVMGVTDVWLNGIHLKTNYGGYLPFVVCLDTAACFGERENILVVKTDNQDDGQVPPGKPQELLDFTYFGGIYRDVWLTAVDSIYITDPLYENVENGGGIVLEYPVVSEEKAIVSVKTQVRSMEKRKQHIDIIYEIKDLDGVHKAGKKQQVVLLSEEMTEQEIEIEIKKPSLWNLEKPFLYNITVSLQNGEMLIDRKTVRFGIRKIEVDREQGLLINGQVQRFLSGINRHQDYPVIGNGAPSAMQKRDAILYKEAGFSVVRSAHYPMSEEFLDACDELGLLLFEATPGWQWYPTVNPEPFSTRVRENIRQMVRRDRNHPCVLAYETVLNETYHVPCGFSRESARTALAEQVSAKIATESYGYDASPSANGIDREADFIYGFEQPLEKTEKAVMFLREYADCYIEFFGQFQSRRVTRGKTDGFYPCGEGRNLIKANQMLFASLEGDYSLADCYKIRQCNPAFVGAAIWTGIDSRGAGSLMSPCGIWDGYRLPKTSYWAFASQQEEKPVLHIASEWTKKAPVLDKSNEAIIIGSDTMREIYVYSNAYRVVLSVEQDTEVCWQVQGYPLIEERASFLPHPPFYFGEVPYIEDSSLRACAYDKKGNMIAEEERKTAKEAYRLSLKAELQGIPLQADGNDLVLLRASVLDQQGTLCTDGQHRIFFQTEGDGTIVGEGDLLADTNPACAEAGIASIYVRAGTTPGKIGITVTAKGLMEDRIELCLVPPKVKDISSLPSEMTKTELHLANLCTHEMKGAAAVIPYAESDGEVFPESIMVMGDTCWSLKGETHLKMGCKRIQGDEQTELFLYLDDVLRWRGKAGDTESILLNVEGANRLCAKVRTSSPGKVLLLSPYLWKEESKKKESQLFENIAFGKPAAASVNTKEAEAVWRDGTWLGGRTKDGIQEWEVDLQETSCVRNAMVQVGGQMGADCTFYEYEIHTSSDRAHWEKQASNRRTSWSNGVLDYFTAEHVRYVKVVFISVDGRLSAGIQKFEIYRDYGVDSVSEYALQGLLAEDNDIVFSPDCLEYTLKEQDKLSIQALAFDKNAKVIIGGIPVDTPGDYHITSVKPVTIARSSCGGTAIIEVHTASGKGVRIYKINF